MLSRQSAVLHRGNDYLKCIASLEVNYWQHLQQLETLNGGKSFQETGGEWVCRMTDRMATQ